MTPKGIENDTASDAIPAIPVSLASPASPLPKVETQTHYTTLRYRVAVGDSELILWGFDAIPHINNFTLLNNAKTKTV